MRLGRTSPPDTLSRVAVFGDHEGAEDPAQAPETATAAAELVAVEALRPHDDWADKANTQVTASVRRMYITDAMVKKFGASMSCPRCQNGAATHTLVSSPYAQQHGDADLRRATRGRG